MPGNTLNNRTKTDRVEGSEMVKIGAEFITAVAGTGFALTTIREDVHQAGGDIWAWIAFWATFGAAEILVLFKARDWVIATKSAWRQWRDD